MHPKGSPRWCKPAPARCWVEQIWGTLLRKFPDSSCVNKDKQLPALKCHCRFKWFLQVCLSFISSCLRLASCLILILLWILQFLISQFSFGPFYKFFCYFKMKSQFCLIQGCYCSHLPKQGAQDVLLFAVLGCEISVNYCTESLFSTQLEVSCEG